MRKIILISILVWMISMSCWAGEKKDYINKAEECHTQADLETLYPILELKALYYQNQQIIAELEDIHQTLKELKSTKDKEISEKQIKLLQEILQELKSPRFPSSTPQP